MHSKQKIALTFLLSLAGTAAFAVLAYTGLFRYLESDFFSERVKVDQLFRLKEDGDAVRLWHENNLARFSDLANERSFQAVFSVRQDDSYFELERISASLVDNLDGFVSLRILDNTGAIQFSTLLSDINSEVLGQRRSYRRWNNEEDVPVLPLGESVREASWFYHDEIGQRFHYVLPLTDRAFNYRGWAVVTMNSTGLEASLAMENRTASGGTVWIVEDRGVVIDLRPSQAARVVGEGLELWSGETSPEPFQIFALAGGSKIPKESYWLATVAVGSGEEKFYIGRLIPGKFFSFSPLIQGLILTVFFTTLSLMFYLLFNLRQEQVVILRERIKKLQIGLIKDWLSGKEGSNYRVKASELELRREEVRKELRRGLGRLKKTDSDIVDDLIDKGWNEILEVMGRQGGDSTTVPTFSDGSLWNLKEIEKIITKAVASVKVSVSPEAISVAEKAVSKPVEMVKVAVTEDLESLEPLEDLSSAAEDLESLEPLEDLSSAAEDLESLAPLEDLSSAAEDLESLEPLEDLSSAAEDLESLEPLEDLSSAAEDLESLEPLEDLSSAAEDLESLAPLEDLSSAAEDLESLEPLEDLSSAAEDLESLEPLEDLSSAAEDLESLAPLEDLSSATEDLESLEPLEDLSSAAEDLESLEPLEDLSSAAEDLESLAPLEDLSSAAEDLESLAPLEDLSSAAEDLESLAPLEDLTSATEDLESLEPLEDLSSAAEDLESLEPLEDLSSAAEDLESLAPLEDLTSATEDLESLEPLEDLSSAAEDLESLAPLEDLSSAAEDLESLAPLEDLSSATEEEFDASELPSELEDLTVEPEEAAIPEDLPQWSGISTLPREPEENLEILPLVLSDESKELIEINHSDHYVYNAKFMQLDYYPLNLRQGKSKIEDAEKPNYSEPSGDHPSSEQDEYEDQDDGVSTWTLREVLKDTDVFDHSTPVNTPQVAQEVDGEEFTFESIIRTHTKGLLPSDLKDSTSKLLMARKRNQWVPDGFDFDHFLFGYQQGATGIYKSLIKIAKNYNALCSVLFEKKEDGLSIDYSIGLDTESASRLSTSKDEPTWRLWFAPRLVVFLQSIKHSPIGDKVNSQDFRFIKSGLFLPILYQKKQSYLFLGFKEAPLNPLKIVLECTGKQ